jgi:hypothetical protein
MSILIVSGIEGVRNCAEIVSKQLDMQVDVAEGRRAALDALRRKEFAVVVVDETLADAIWELSSVAIPLQINFALSGAARIIREIRAAVHRREKEQVAARLAAREDIGIELKNTVTGLVLQSQLALTESGVPNQVAQKLRVVAELACTLRNQLAVVPTSAPDSLASTRRRAVS